VGDVWIVCWVQPSGISWNMEHWVTSCTQPGMLMHVHCCAPTIAVCLNRVAVTTRSSSSRLRRARVFVGTRQSGGGAAALDAVIVHAVLNVVGRRAGACSLTRGTRRVAAEARRRAHVARRCLRAADHLVIEEAELAAARLGHLGDVCGAEERGEALLLNGSDLVAVLEGRAPVKRS